MFKQVFSDFSGLFSEPLFDYASIPLPRVTLPPANIRVNVFDRPNHVEVIAPLPGISKEEIEITFDNGNLVLSLSPKGVGSDSKTILREFSPPKGKRSLSFGSTPLDGNIEAEFKDGILSVKVFKLEKSVPKRIEIA